MKKLIITMCLGFMVTGLWAQNDTGAKIVTVSQAIQNGQDPTTLDVGGVNTDVNFQFQVGVPFIFQEAIPTGVLDEYYSYLNFPWSILYIYSTFSEDPESFDVSKGYFSNNVLITWELKSNYDFIKYIKIYRRKYTLAGNGNWLFLANVDKDATQYEDKYVDGGVLYEYKIEADGIVGDEYLTKYITGIGFRSPTAIVTGNVNYGGGSPVEDVTVTAEADGSSVNLGSALNIQENAFLVVPELSNPIETATTLQAWVKPEVAFADDAGNAIRLFNLSDGSRDIQILVKLLATSNSLEISVDGIIFNIQDFYPSGIVNARGDDELIPVANFNTTFTHISVLVEDASVPKLFINGRPITKDYETLVQDIEGLTLDNNENFIKPYETFTVSDITDTNDLSTANGNKWNTIKFGGSKDVFIDEIRVWNSVLSSSKIRTDYKRYISGNDARLICYLRANEGLGDFAYDYSREGFNYNKNHVEFVNASSGGSAVSWVSGAGNIPTADQLGVLGVTDANGNYEISAIPYSGTGESFTITPAYGKHQFEPNQKLVYLGEGSTVVNEINFVDKSSFIFKGRVLYDTQNVFVPFTDKIPGGELITDSGYNTYDIDGVPYAKGQYWLNKGDIVTDPLNSNKTDDTLDEYAQIFVEGANIYIDGEIVLDENNLPAVTNATDGSFSVSVPIGNHYITVKKEGHVFEYNGRFPEASIDPKNNFSEFIQNRENVETFIDKTRVTVVGRVVGGAVEAQKVIGFGKDGVYSETYSDANGNDAEETISSINNIGQANITFNYPDIDNAQTETKFNFDTNIDSGEFRVEVLPINYQYKSTDISILNNNDNIVVGPTDALDLNFSDIPEQKKPEFESDNIANMVFGDPYHYKQSFNYRSTPVLNVIEQQSEASVDVNGELFLTDGFEYPLYKQFNVYVVELQTFEKYTNYDGLEAVENIVPVIDGELIVNNNLALDGTEAYVPNPQDASYTTYSFKAGIPSFAANNSFVKTLSIKYRVGEKDYDPTGDYEREGVILGGGADGTKTFVTSAPDVPDIILRDPPGSNSFSSIESGQSISITAESALTDTEGISENLTVNLGTVFGIGGGLAGVSIKTEITNSLEGEISLAYSSNNGEALTKTYSFNQTISTNDDPDWVGADADLYIGNSLNYFYGSFNDLKLSASPIGELSENVPLVNAAGETVYLSVQKGFSMSPDPSDTFFIFSQRYILKDLIPEYISIIEAINLPGSTLIPGEDGVLTVEDYERQIKTWKKVIIKNELDKYIALTPKWRDKKKEILESVTSALNNDLIGLIEDSDDPLGESKLRNKLASSKRVSELLDQYYSENISFDAGVGEISRSVETAIILGTSTEYDITIDESVQLTLGGEVMGKGVVSSTKGFFQQNINTALSSETETTTVFSYTLKDNDESNLLSIDVLNEFGDYGPVFSTQAGRTSCPYEGGEVSKFFTKTKFENYVSEYLPIQLELQGHLAWLRKFESQFQLNNLTSEESSSIKESLKELNPKIEVLEKRLKDLDEALITDVDCCEEAKKAPLSFGTQKVEVPLLSIEIADVSNIPESEKAEFTLLLENNSASGTDADFLLKIDNTTNPNNALINIEPNGTIVNVPYGQAVTYKMTLGKSISDVYDYENVRVVLQSLCDGEDVSDEVFVTASFVPSCSNVVVSVPVNNWVYNINSAYNTDGSTKPLNINLNGFNASFNSFEKIDLQYRLATSPNWTTLQTYYASQSFYDDAITAGSTVSQISLIESADLLFPFDIADRSLQDGDYDIRARSTCASGIEFISEVITGTVDLNAPLRFGTPLPTDGILGAGEDLRVSFNENIFYNTAISKIEILGATNQLPINNNVSLYFEGANNVVTIEKPRIVSGNFSLEFWMNNATVASSATMFSQIDGLNIGLVNGQMSATIAGINAIGAVATDNLFHHYTITLNNETGSLSIYQDDSEIAGASGVPNAQFTNSNTLVIGGNSFIGNIHDLRLWSKSLTLSSAYANIYTQIIGNENGLLGYWPMDEGRGAIANDLAFFKHGIVNASWDIKPKGNAYEFASGHYLELDQLGFAQLTNTMDATISFWVKTATAQEATIFSNGRGDGTDLVQSNGFANKWAINMSSAGTLSFDSEGNSYGLTTKSVADNTWHHVALLFNRLGSLRTYIDAQQVSSNTMADIGGFSGNQAWLGARGYKDANGIESIDRVFTGKLDEFRLWNTVRTVEQISRDRYNEIDNQSIGLMLYARMNAPKPTTGNGPRYFHTGSGEDNVPDNAVLQNGAVSYANDAPAIKPARNLIKFEVNRVINEDDMIIEPVVSDWAVLEGQVLDITVDRMFDAANNRMQSPITWTAYVQRNEVSWFADGFNEIVDLVNYRGDDKSFEITLINGSGKSQPYAITNVPNWMQLSSSSGTLSPDSKKIITVTIDIELAAGIYNEILFLETDFGFNQKLPVNLRVLEKEPVWAINPNDYAYSTNIVGRIKVDGIFSEDMYDRIGAFYNDEVRGVTNLVYDPSYKQYYLYLTIYSNNPSGETIEFRIWDATRGKILQSTIDGNISIPFLPNDILGNLVNPTLFENTTAVEQNLALNKGWTWVSFNVDDVNFSNINTLTNNLLLETNDRLLSYAPSQLETYTDGFGWDGQISSQGGLSVNKMFKVYFGNAQSLKIKGTPVDIGAWNFPVSIDWNWLPFNLPSNTLLNEAMASYQATSGDVIKSQNLFAIYDQFNGWIGSLNYLEEGKGYMLKSGVDQLFKYPQYFGKSSSVKGANIPKEYQQEKMASDFTKYSNNMNAVVLLPDGYNELLVFDRNNTLKGEARTATYNNKELSFITIYGDRNEDLVFHVRNGSEMKPTTKTFTFNKNDVLGTFANPIDLREKMSGVSLYPNPFSNAFSLEVDVDTNQTAVVKLYSMTGQLVYTQDFKVTKGFNVISITPKVSNGIYMIHLVTNKHMLINKIIKN
jgi:hypothetical protein